MNRNLKLNLKILLLLLLPGIAFAQMESQNYRMERDSLNSGGLESSSSQYGLTDTVGEIATGDSDSSNYMLRAGFQQMEGSYLAVSIPNTVNLPQMGFSTKSSQGDSPWHVVTDSPAGYSMSVKSLNSPAMSSVEDNSFADYIPSTANADYNFTLNPSDSEFAFSPFGEDVADRYKNDGSSCGSGSQYSYGKCWDGFSTSTKNIVMGTSSNHPEGATTTLIMRAEVGSGKNQPSGQYSAELEVTVIAL